MKIDRTIEILEALASGCSPQTGELIENDSVLNDPYPRVRFREFADHGIKLQLLFWISKPEVRGRTVDEVNTTIYKKFSDKKIVIPYPTMKVLLPQKETSS